MEPKPFLGLAIADQLTAEYGIPVYNPATGLFEQSSVSAVRAAPARELSATVTADQNDWSPTGLSATDVVYATPDNAWTITGLAAQPSGTRIQIVNSDASRPLVFSSEDSRSSAANRFDFSQFAAIILTPAEVLNLQYQGTSSRWVCVGGLFGQQSFQRMLAAHRWEDDTTGIQTSVTGGATAASEPGWGVGRVMKLATGAGATDRAGAGSANLELYAPYGPCVVKASAFLDLDTISDATDRYTIRAGFMDSISGEPVDGIYLRGVDNVNAGKWEAVPRSNSTGTAVDTGVTIAGNVGLVIVSYPERALADFYLSGNYVARVTGIPAAVGRGYGIGFSIIKALGTTSRFLAVSPTNLEWVSRFGI